MDFEEIRRRQSLKVVFSEALMVLAVIATVVVLAFIVSGYWVSSDFEVKRQGLLQISSIPTGASVDIDGDSSWLQRTNTSKVLSSGKHTVKLSKDGYDSWTKEVDIKEGLLYRIHYPRLFLEKRETEKISAFAETTFATVSPDRTSLILVNNTTEWSYLNLDKETIEPNKINIETLFSDVSLAPGAKKGLFGGEILSADWDASSNRVLFKVRSENGLEWVLLNPKDVKNSINLTKEFGVNFSDVVILNNDANSLLAIQNHNLHKIDVAGKSTSAVLAENVVGFDHYQNEIVFSAMDNNDEADAYYVGTFKLGDNEITKLETLPSPTKVLIAKFYEEKYIITVTENITTLYLKEDYSEVSSFELSFSPKTIKVGHEGEFIIMYSGSEIATLDMEAMEIREWSVEGESFGWIDNDMIYTVNDGELIVYDFDGLNRRVIANNVSNRLPAAITENRYLYYFSDDTLMREWLIPR